MKKHRTRLAVLGVAALALGAIVLPGSAQAAKVTESAGGGLVPPEIDGGPGLADTSVPFVQEFRLRGKKVNKRQVLDVNVTVNGFGNVGDTLDEINARLVGPKGDNVFLPLPGIGSGMVNLEFDDQSLLRPCNPFAFTSDDCNYIQGATAASTAFGSFTGELSATLNPVFHGLNPRGTWRLIWRDGDSDADTVTLGESELRVKTGKRFAKE